MTADTFSGKFQEKLSAVKSRLKGGKIMVRYQKGLEPLGIPEIGGSGDDSDNDLDAKQEILEKRKNYQEISCQALMHTVCEKKMLAIILFNDDKSEAYSYGIENPQYLKLLRDVIDKILTGKGDYEKIYA